jgi:hypothetical protein
MNDIVALLEPVNPDGILEEHAAEIRNGMRALRLAMSNALDIALVVGKRLTIAKDQVGDGKWSKWLRDDCELSRSTALLYMRRRSTAPQSYRRCGKPHPSLSAGRCSPQLLSPPCSSCCRKSRSQSLSAACAEMTRSRRSASASASGATSSRPQSWICKQSEFPLDFGHPPERPRDPIPPAARERLPACHRRGRRDQFQRRSIIWTIIRRTAMAVP